MKPALATGLLASSALLAATLWLAQGAVPAGKARPFSVASLLAVSSPAEPVVAPVVDTPEALAPTPSAGWRVERLVASGDPADAYHAFRLIDRCAREIDAGRRAGAACEDIGAVHHRLRLALLESAARAGVPGAVTAWTGEGPFGDKSALTQRPDDPLVAAWVREAVQMIRSAARRDDVAAITQLGWLAVHWDMSDSERLHAMVGHAAEWAPTNRPAVLD